MAYPETTTDHVKVLAELGFQGAPPSERRTYVGLKANEHWLPVLQFVSTTAGGIRLGLLTEVIIRSVWPELEPAEPLALEPPQTQPEPLLHVEWHFVSESGSEEAFLADGPVSEVLESLKTFVGDESG